MNQTITNRKQNKRAGCIKIFVGFIVLSIIIGFIQEAMMSDEEKEQRELKKAKEQASKDSLEFERERASQLRTKLVRAEIHSEDLLKQSLKDPKSYEKIDIESGYSKDSSIVVNITYRATNSFGGYIQDKKQFVYSKDGKIENIN